MSIAFNVSDERTEITSLVVAAQSGDRNALDTLFSKFERLVYCVVFKRLRNEAEAEEVRQDVFIQAMLKIGQLNEPACFGGWIRQIASRMAINRATRRRNMLPLDTPEQGPVCEDYETPLGAALVNESHEQVREGLGRLSELDRSTIEAFYFNGQSINEMSQRFDSPVGTIKRRLHTARKRLAEQLEEAMVPA